MKKGISAVIGSILLVMITVAVVSAAYVFMNRAADTAANGTENKARETVQAVGNKFAIENVNKNVVYIRNLGTLEIGDPAFYVENSEVSHSGPASLLAGKVGTYLLDESVLDKFCGTVTLKVIVGPFSKKTTIDLSKNSVLLFKSGANLAMKIFDTGNAAMRGTLTQNMVSIPSSSDDEIRILAADKSNAAVINLVTGNMYIKGSLYENQAALAESPAKSELVIKDSAGSVLAIIDESGDFYLKGKLTQNSVFDEPC